MADMTVMLSDPVIQVDGWTPDLNIIGEYNLKIRKTPEEVRLEKERRASAGRPGKVNPIRMERRSVLSFDGKVAGRVYFLPGLWPRVSEFLKAKGRTYEIVDKRNPEIRPPLDMKAFEGVEFRETQDTAVALIASLDCGIIETSTGYGKSFILSILCKAYPTLNIVVTTSSTSVVQTLYEYLCKTIPGEVGVLYAGKNTVAGKRVVVTTLKSLPNIPPEKVQLVFVDECHAISDNIAGQELMKFCWARRFGFSASPVRNDGSQLAMEAILGPTILKMTYQEATDAGMVTPMKYMMLQCGTCPSVAKQPNLPDVMLKRWSYWDNWARNDAIRKFVYDLKQVYDGQILIVVNTLEHCIHLHRLLPWFVVAYYGNADIEDLKRRFPPSKYPGLDLAKYKMSSKQLEITRKALAKGTLKYVISTKILKQGVNLQHLECLIRADGDVSEVEGIQIPGRLSRLDEGKEYAYLVDVEDTFSQWAHGRAVARMKLYDRNQWQRITYEECINGLGEQSKRRGEEPAG